MRYEVKEYSSQKDEFGPEHVYAVLDHCRDEVGWVVVDNTRRGPTGTGKGGTAMYPECDLGITKKKARVMTWKQVFCVPIGEKPIYTPWGGAKGGIRGDYNAPNGKAKLRAWARALYDAGVIPHRYIFGLDVGLNESATREVVEELGSPLVSTGKPTDLGGIPYDELGITGLGLLESLKPMCEYAGIDFASPQTSIAIQGFGAVGRGFMLWLSKLPAEARPRVVAISDVGGSVYCAAGFEPGLSLSVASQFGTIARYPGAEPMPLGSELYLGVDILLLAYKENQITESNVHNVQAEIVLQGANLGVSREAELILHQRGVVMLPDFVVNAGASSIAYVEYAGGSSEAGIDYVKKVVPHNARIILDDMRSGTRDPREVALAIAQREVRKGV